MWVEFSCSISIRYWITLTENEKKKKKKKKVLSVERVSAVLLNALTQKLPFSEPNRIQQQRNRPELPTRESSEASTTQSTRVRMKRRHPTSSTPDRRGARRRGRCPGVTGLPRVTDCPDRWCTSPFHWRRRPRMFLTLVGTPPLLPPPPPPPLPPPLLLPLLLHHLLLHLRPRRHRRLRSGDVHFCGAPIHSDRNRRRWSIHYHAIFLHYQVKYHSLDRNEHLYSTMLWEHQRWSIIFFFFFSFLNSWSVDDFVCFDFLSSSSRDSSEDSYEIFEWIT